MTQIIVTTIICIFALVGITVVCATLLDVKEKLTEKDLDAIRKDLEEYSEEKTKE